MYGLVPKQVKNNINYNFKHQVSVEYDFFFNFSSHAELNIEIYWTSELDILLQFLATRDGKTVISNNHVFLPGKVGNPCGALITTAPAAPMPR